MCPVTDVTSGAITHLAALSPIPEWVSAVYSMDSSLHNQNKHPPPSYPKIGFFSTPALPTASSMILHFSITSLHAPNRTN